MRFKIRWYLFENSDIDPRVCGAIKRIIFLKNPSFIAYKVEGAGDIP